MLVCRMRHDKPHQQVAWGVVRLRPDPGPAAAQRQPVVRSADPAAARDRTPARTGRGCLRPEMEQRFDRRPAPCNWSVPAAPIPGRRLRRAPGRPALRAARRRRRRHAPGHRPRLQLRPGQRAAPRQRRAGCPRPWRHRRADGAVALRTPAPPGNLLLYQATNLLVDVYTNDRLPARLLRGAGLRVAQGLLPLRKGIARHLTSGA